MNTKRYSGIQPQYFPRLHYFARMLNTDVFMLRDDVQFLRKHKYPDGSTDKSYQAHAPIKHESGRRLLPVGISHEGYTSIYDTGISREAHWRDENLKLLREGYKNAPNFEKLQQEIKTILEKSYENLAELNITTLIWGFLHIFDKPTDDLSLYNLKIINSILEDQKEFRLKKILRATETEISPKLNSMSANEKILALMKELNATEDYCGGTAVSAYMEHDLFKENGITTIVQDWKCREYSQQFSKRHPFIPNLSIIDLLMNVTSQDAFRILQ